MENKTPKNSQARIDANNKYAKNHYDRISLVVPKGSKELWSKKAIELGYNSLNDFINKVIKEEIKRGAN